MIQSVVSAYPARIREMKAFENGRMDCAAAGKNNLQGL